MSTPEGIELSPEEAAALENDLDETTPTFEEDTTVNPDPNPEKTAETPEAEQTATADPDKDIPADDPAQPGDDNPDAGGPDDTDPIPVEEAFMPHLKVGTQEEIQGLKTKLDELKEQFDEGEIDHDTYLNERDTITIGIAKAEMAADFNAQMFEQGWEKDQAAFLTDHPEYNENRPLYDALSAAIERIEGSEAGGSLTNAQLLVKAHEEVAGAFGLAKSAADGSSTDKTKNLIRQAKKSAASREAIPQTLAEVPVAEDNGTEGNAVFQQLDKLEGPALEAALEKMPPEQAEAYLAAS